MFRHQGPARSERQNRLLAGYLAMVGGFVNSSGFVIIGTFTSHVTGNVGRFADDVVTGQVEAAATALTMLVGFVIGAFVASMIIESNFFGRTANAYSVALLLEGVLLALFMAVTRYSTHDHPRLLDLEAAILCATMGLQNSLVTRLSGAVVRTTHLTGVFTDIGIESARWFRWWRSTLSERLRVKLAFGRNPAEKPAGPKIQLLLTISLAFFIGALIGAASTLMFLEWAMSIPCLGVLTCAAYAFVNGRRTDDHAPLPETRR